MCFSIFSSSTSSGVRLFSSSTSSRLQRRKGFLRNLRERSCYLWFPPTPRRQFPVKSPPTVLTRRGAPANNRRDILTSGHLQAAERSSLDRPFPWKPRVARAVFTPPEFVWTLSSRFPGDTTVDSIDFRVSSARRENERHSNARAEGNWICNETRSWAMDDAKRMTKTRQHQARKRQETWREEGDSKRREEKKGTARNVNRRKIQQETWREERGNKKREEKKETSTLKIDSKKPNLSSCY